MPKTTIPGTLYEGACPVVDRLKGPDQAIQVPWATGTLLVLALAEGAAETAETMGAAHAAAWTTVRRDGVIGESTLLMFLILTMWISGILQSSLQPFEMRCDAEYRIDEFYCSA